MLVNSTLADVSDLSLRTAFAVYIVCLILACIHYMRAQAVIDLKRERAAVEEKELVAVGGGTGAEKSRSAELDSSGVTDEEIDAARLRARKMAGSTQYLTWVGIIFHVVAVVTRGMSVSRFPMGNMYEFVITSTAVTMVAAAVIIQRRGWHTTWPWLLAPNIVLLFLAATVLYVKAAPLVPALQSFWYPFHVSIVSVGASIGLISGMFSLLYLLRIWQPRGEEKGFFGAIAKPLPSAKKLDSYAYRTAIITLPVFGIGIMLGAIWGEVAWGRFWGWDPKETVALITWILYAAYLHARATAGWKNAKAAWINVAAFVTSIFNLFFINLVATGLHSYAGLN
ncbi:c-type cytochrome biogenesis protein CcsB [Corynebacterium tuscaniense]|uniref:c-type cytochrome biogenesis protein CcsB n=1 Tax=Corynebacterium tuscaniense TaxID=302449 RepID=UPI00123A9C3A|nr:c-type cytochrome biogenesis protein CcsB [Corynebacterium tuscaniense]KAA8743877.1 c-type cytochrome biogenesis protein CcsB [Corynebacterium tuscaniense]